MFSGIVERVGLVESLVASRDGGRVLIVRSDIFRDDVEPRDDRPVRLGDSISISGVCLTVVALNGHRASFDVGSETIRRTTLASWKTGREVNLERSLRVGDRLDGHIVQGHVDAVCEVLRRDEEGNTIRLLLTLPPPIAPFVVEKGSVTVDGVSLTVGEAEAEQFTVYIIPHTAEITTLRTAQPGTLLNVEADCIARYLSSLAERYVAARAEKSE